MIVKNRTIEISGKSKAIIDLTDEELATSLDEIKAREGESKLYAMLYSEMCRRNGEVMKSKYYCKRLNK